MSRKKELTLRTKWEESGPGMNAMKLEAILRHYFELHSLYESTGKDELNLPDGMVVNIHDLKRMVLGLPVRQRQAIVLTCIYNRREVDAARLMGIQRWSSPVGTYKRRGLAKLVIQMNEMEYMNE